MRERVLAWLTENVPASRVNHILRVEQMAIELAGLYNQDQRKAATAGLMHDLAKYFKPHQLLPKIMGLKPRPSGRLFIVR